MSDCLFCKIANGEIPADIVDESEDAVAILDIHPKAPGHIMVIPKIHAETILDLPDEKVGGVFLAVKRATEKLVKALSPDGFTLGVNHGKNAGQAIDHLHIHIIPRFKGDGGGSIHTIVDNPPEESLENIKQQILNSKL
ncbi:MAG: HIT family protein [bacterium]|nr:HIT family protein [bacterium]